MLGLCRDLKLKFSRLYAHSTYLFIFHQHKKNRHNNMSHIIITKTVKSLVLQTFDG